MILNIAVKPPVILSSSQISDLRLAVQKMTGVERRSFQAQMFFQAQMLLKYCMGNARQIERTLGWGRPWSAPNSDLPHLLSKTAKFWT